MKYFSLLLLLICCSAYSQLNYMFLSSNKCPGIADTVLAVGDSNYVWFLTDDPATILAMGDTLIYTEQGSFGSNEISLASDNDTITFSMSFHASFCYCQCYVPNVFTPDGNAFNDKFYPVIKCGSVQGVRLTICDRKGKVVFDETSYDAPRWNGTHPETGEILQSNMYGWQISFIDELGETHHYQGHVFLFK